MDNLTKYYGDPSARSGQALLAVDHISFEVKQGEIFGFLGHNGAGKTTTQRMLTTLLEPTEGRIVINGHDPAFYLEHMEAIVKEEMRLMLTRIVAGRGIAEALHVEELTDELRRVLHAKLLRQAGHQLSDQFKRHFEER